MIQLKIVRLKGCRDESRCRAVAKRPQKRYREYRGRRPGGSVVLKIIIVLLVLLILACVIFFSFLGGRVEYTDDGVRIVTPWGDSKTDPSPEPSGSPSPIIVVD